MAARRALHSHTVGEREIQKKDNGLFLSFFLEKAVPQLSHWCQTLRFLPVYHWCLSSCYCSAGPQREWVWVTPVCGFFKRNCLRLQKFLPLTQSPLIFAARSCGDLSSWHWNLGLGFLVWGWDSLLLRYPSRMSIHHMWMWDQPILCFCPSYQSGWTWFLYFCSCQTSIQLDFLWFWVMVVL